MERLDAFDALRRPAPAGNLEAKTTQRRAASLAEHPNPITPTATSSPPLIELVPAVRTLLGVVAALAAVMHQHMQHDVLGHPHR